MALNYEYKELFARQLARVAASAAPTSGTWNVGDLVWNDTPTAGEPTFWVCTSAGSPGTWVAAGLVQTTTATAISAAGSISPSDSIVDVGTGGFNITLTAPTTVQNGALIAIVNDTASACTLVAGSGTTLIAGSAVIAANTSVQVRAAAGLYYRI